MGRELRVVRGNSVHSRGHSVIVRRGLRFLCVWKVLVLACLLSDALVTFPCEASAVVNPGIMSSLGKRAAADMGEDDGSWPNAKRSNQEVHPGLEHYEQDVGGGENENASAEEDGGADNSCPKKRHYALEHNARMHGRNRYLNHPPDFTALAKSDAKFASLVTWDAQEKAHVDWRKPTCAVALTRALLKQDFGLDWSLPEGFLCPPVTQRCNYLHWIGDLLAGQLPAMICRPQDVPVPSTARGLDVGVGASCIYPLLGARIYPGWSWMGSEASPEAMANAADLVERNGLASVITLRKVEGSGRPLRDALEGVEGTLDFTMCNPPFFANISEARGAALVRACPGTLSELVTEGGEVQFVQKMLEDSSYLKGRVGIYTTMLGHKASLKACSALAKRMGATRIVETEFFQGYTIRWGLAWSFTQRDARSASHRFAIDWTSEQMAMIGKGAVLAVPSTSFEWDDKASGPWIPPGCHPKCHGELVCWRAVGQGSVAQETWTRRARRGHGAPPGPAGGLFKFWLMLEAVGKDVIKNDAEQEATHPLLRYTEWIATFFLVEPDLTEEEENGATARLFDSYCAQVFKSLPT